MKCFESCCHDKNLGIFSVAHQPGVADDVGEMQLLSEEQNVHHPRFSSVE